MGIFAAEDIETRDRRLMTFELANRIVALPVDEEVSRAWSQMRAYVQASGQEGWGQRHVDRGDRGGARDPSPHPGRDFDALSGVAGLTVIPV